MLDRHLKKITSQSDTAGLSLSTSVKHRGLGLLLNGYNDKMETFFEMVMSEMKALNGNMDQSIFDLEKSHLKKNYRNSLLGNRHLSTELFNEILRVDYYTDFELYEEIDNISIESLQKFTQMFFRKLKVQVLVQGNMTKAQALNIAGILQTHVACEPLDEEFELLHRNYALPVGSNVLRLTSLSLNNDNSYTSFFYQTIDVNLRSISLCHLVVSILDSRAFNFLRNQEQLGYSVGINYYKNVGILGFFVHVSSQEGKHRYAEVHSKMETFVNEVARKTIEDLTEQEFEPFKESRIKSLLADVSSAQTEATTNWNEITQQDYVFDRHELSAKVTESLTKQDVRDFFNSMTQENPRKIILAVIGNTQQSEVEGGKASDQEPKVQIIADKLTEEENVITNVEEFKDRLSLRPVLKFSIQ